MLMARRLDQFKRRPPSEAPIDQIRKRLEIDATAAPLAEKNADDAGEAAARQCAEKQTRQIGIIR